VKEDVQEGTEVQYSTGVQAESDRIKGKEGDGFLGGKDDDETRHLRRWPRSKGRTRRRSEQAWVTKALATSKAWMDGHGACFGAKKCPNRRQVIAVAAN
jgi:hypothetical protein